MDYPLFDAYFKYVENTESPLIFHRWSLLTALGAHLGRQYHLPFGDFRIFANMYVMLIGDPGTRKSSAVKLSTKGIASTGYSTFAHEKTSKEKFLMDLAGMDDAASNRTVDTLVMENLGWGGVHSEAKEVFIAADEFLDFIGSANLEFISLLGTLWDWDSEKPYQNRFKNSQSIEIYQPTVSILGGCTHATFATAFPPQTIGQGFLSRLLLVFSESSGIKIPFPERPSEETRTNLAECFAEVRAKVTGEAVFTAEAKGMIGNLYRTFKGLEDGRFLHYSTRRHTHLLKLCLLTSAARFSTTIDSNDVVLANTILSYAEHRMPQALGEFGKSKNSDVAAKIVATIFSSKDPVTDEELWKQVSSDLESIDLLQKMLSGLIQAGKIQFINTSRVMRGYMPVKQVLDQNKLYVDFSLLQESAGSTVPNVVQFKKKPN